jgi:hypothetical protein
VVVGDGGGLAGKLGEGWEGGGGVGCSVSRQEGFTRHINWLKCWR